MAQITWKNIDAPDFKASMLGLDAAGDRLNTAFDPLEQALKDRSARSDRNYDTETKNTDIALQDNVRKIQNLGELNQMNEQDYIAQARQRFGNRISAEGIESGFNDTRGLLRERAINEATPGALAVGSESYSLLDAEKAFSDKLRSMGAKESFIQEASGNFMNNNAALKDRYAEDRRKNADSYLLTVNSPKNSTELEEIMENAQAEGATPKDLDYLRSRLTKETEAIDKDFTRDQAKLAAKWSLENHNNIRKERAYAKAERDFFDKSSAEGMAMLREGKSPHEVLSIITKGGSGANNLRLTNQLTDMYIKTRTIDDVDAEKLKSASIADNEKFSNYKNQALEISNHYRTIAENAGGVTAEDIQIAKNLEVGTKGIVSAIAADAADGNTLHISSWFESKDGKAALAAVNKPYRSLLAQSIPEDVARVIAVKAFHAIADKTSNFWGQDVIPADAYAKAIAAGGEKYLDAKEHRTASDNMDKKIAQETDQMAYEIAMLQSNRLSQMAENKMTGGSITKDSVDQGVKKDRLNSVESLIEASPIISDFKTAKATYDAEKAQAALEAKAAAQESKKEAEFEEFKQKELDAKAFKDTVAKESTVSIGKIGKDNNIEVFDTSDGIKVKKNGKLVSPSIKDNLKIADSLMTPRRKTRDGSYPISAEDRKRVEAEADEARLRSRFEQLYKD